MISLKTFILTQLAELELNHQYELGTDTVRSWIDVYTNQCFTNQIKSKQMENFKEVYFDKAVSQMHKEVKANVIEHYIVQNGIVSMIYKNPHNRNRQVIISYDFNQKEGIALTVRTKILDETQKASPIVLDEVQKYEELEAIERIERELEFSEQNLKNIEDTAQRVKELIKKSN